MQCRFSSVACAILLTGVFAALPGTTAAWASPLEAEQRIAREAEALRTRLIELRRELHMYPELSNREERTSRIMAERLRQLGLEDIRTGVGKYGVTALLKGGKPGPVVAIRADMDALPIQETLDVPYKSRNPGVKHACGHDVHMSVALGAAEVLSRMRADIPGTIKFIFQPAEEGPPPGEEGGAELMVKEGALEDPRPRAIFGLHVNPLVETGKVVYTSGPAMAASDRFVIGIRGRKVHAAYPEQGVDPIVAAAQAILALQTIRSRRVDTGEPFVLSVGVIQGGNRFNIIPDEVLLEGTLRTVSESVRSRVQELMRTTLAGVTSAMGAGYELTFYPGALLTYNDPGLVEETLPALKRVLGEENVESAKPAMGSEDFSTFQRVIPGFYYWLGVGNKARGITAMIHTPEFDADEESLVVGVKAMAGVALDHLQRHARP